MNISTFKKAAIAAMAVAVFSTSGITTAQAGGGHHKHHGHFKHHGHKKHHGGFYGSYGFVSSCEWRKMKVWSEYHYAYVWKKVKVCY